MASWGSGILFAIDMQDGAIERQTWSIDGVDVTGRRIASSSTFSISPIAAANADDDNRNPECKKVTDVESDWQITLGGYVGGPGGELTFGHDQGNFFVTLRVGFGVGGGASWSPGGAIPGPAVVNRNVSGSVLSISGQAGGSMLGVVNGSAELGVARNYNMQESDWYGDLTGAVGTDGQQGVRGSASIGAQYTYYTARQSFYENEGTCHL